ncbi:MAG: tetratricopeptide repeat protein [Kiritimatiellaceae bacterium]|nr:tetratricopeptide repeat protein [Kiritimatiellaceae bacterium]
MMKIFRSKKKTPPPSSQPHVSKSELEQSFYSRAAGEVPLDDAYRSTATRQTQRTSRHSPGRRRETSNRASNRAIFWLLFRTAAIVVSLAVGFFALKWGLNKIDEPTTEEQLLAESVPAIENIKPTIVSSTNPSLPAELTVTPTTLEKQIQHWDASARDFRSAETFYRRGIDEDAVQKLGQILNVMPNHRTSLKMLMDIYIQRELFAEAVPLCIRLLEQEGSQPELQLTLLTTLQKSGQTGSALTLATHLLNNQPNHLTILSIAAEGHLQMGDTNAALPLFEKIISLDPQHTNALKACGEIYYSKGDYARATTHFTELIQQDPKLSHFAFLASCYAQQTNAGQCILTLGQAANRYSPAEVGSVLQDPVFNSIRETIDFRAFTDRMVGINNRKALEELNKREVESEQADAEASVLPKQPNLRTPKIRDPAQR